MFDICVKNPAIDRRWLNYLFRGAYLVISYKTECECCIAGRWITFILCVFLLPHFFVKCALLMFAIMFFIVGKEDYDYQKRKEVYEK